MADSKSAGSERSKTCIQLPEMSFSTFILSLSSSAMVHLGEAANPESGEIREAPQLAKHTIDILGMLQCKFEKGLEPDEKKLLGELLYSLRMKYVNKIK